MNGKLYGATPNGGDSDKGTLFQYRLSGTASDLSIVFLGTKGRTVNLSASDGSQTVSSTATCTGGQYSQNLNLSNLNNGNVTITASYLNASNTRTSVSQVVVKYAP